MCEIMRILEREPDNAQLIYIYRENDGKWYAYEKSAFYLSRIMEGLYVERYIMDETLWLARAKVDINRLPKEFVISYTDKEYVLRYTPHNGFSEWLSDIQ